jgi:hypothetical protein
MISNRGKTGQQRTQPHICAASSTLTCLFFELEEISLSITQAILRRPIEPAAVTLKPLG